MEDNLNQKTSNSINWFPGHMAKALRMMEESVKLCDGLVFVLDARAPFACFNDKIIKLANNKPILYVINKIDMIEKADLDKIIACFKAQEKYVLPIIGTLPKDGKAVYRAIIDIFNDKLQAKKEKGINKTLRVMVCGIPNTGKSTIINSLSGKKQAQTGNKAGVTRGKQWIKLEGIELLDTPGTTPPKLENQTYAKHLAYIGSLNDDVMDLDSLLLDFIAEIKEKYTGVLSSRYGVDESLKLLEIYEQICVKRGYVLRGGEFDYSRCSKAVFDDFRKVRLGKICLETQPIN